MNEMVERVTKRLYKVLSASTERDFFRSNYVAEQRTGDFTEVTLDGNFDLTALARAAIDEALKAVSLSDALADTPNREPPAPKN
jgi:hypothetical protein